MEDDYNLDEVKGFVKNYCDPEVDVDQQLKDSAWILLQELNKCPNHNEESNKKEEESKDADQEKVKKEKKDFVEHKKEVISEKKLKQLQNKSQGKSSYFEFARQQAKAIGMAGLMAMGAGAITQAEIIKKESVVIVEHIRKEVPLVDQILNKIIDLFSGNNDPQAKIDPIFSGPPRPSEPDDPNNPIPKPIIAPSITDVNPLQN